MGKQFASITSKFKEFIEDQKVFFVGTAAAEGKINVSPKGMDAFRVIDENKIVWLNLTGSGNETAAHLFQNGRMTIMFCAFEGKPLILRLYGKAQAHHRRDAPYQKYIGMFPENIGSRQIIEMQVDMVQASCGFGVPILKFDSERETLTSWAENKGEEMIEEYWQEKNSISLDGFETKIMEA